MKILCSSASKLTRQSLEKLTEVNNDDRCTTEELGQRPQDQGWEPWLLALRASRPRPWLPRISSWDLLISTKRCWPARLEHHLNAWPWAGWQPWPPPVSCSPLSAIWCTGSSKAMAWSPLNIVWRSGLSKVGGHYCLKVELALKCLTAHWLELNGGSNGFCRCLCSSFM